MSSPAVAAVPFAEIDAANADEFAAWLGRHRHLDSLVLDMRRVMFLDSSGIRTIVLERRAREHPASLRLQHLSPGVQRVLEICGLADELCNGPAMADDA